MWIDDRIEQLRQEFFRQGREFKPAPGVSDAVNARKVGELYAKYQEQKDALLARRDMMVAKALMEEDDGQEDYHS